MKWPLVWREDYDEACRVIRRLETTLAELRARNEESLRHANDALHIIERLTIPAVAVTPPNLAPALPEAKRDELTEAIELSAGHDKSLQRHLTRWAKQQQLDGVKDHDIIQSVIHWHNANEWDGDVSDVPNFI
jgi:hypothetical protein